MSWSWDSREMCVWTSWSHLGLEDITSPVSLLSHGQVSSLHCLINLCNVVFVLGWQVMASVPVEGNSQHAMGSSDSDVRPDASLTAVSENSMHAEPRCMFIWVCTFRVTQTVDNWIDMQKMCPVVLFAISNTKPAEHILSAAAALAYPIRYYWKDLLISVQCDVNFVKH